MNYKTAQRLSFWQKMREKAHQGKDLKKEFLGSEEYREIVDQLTQSDDAVRELAADLKSLLKSAESNFNRREYMLAIAYLAKFHEKINQIMEQFKLVSDKVHQQHHVFLFGDLEPEHKEYITKKLPEWFKAPTKKASFDKEAGLADWWYSITTDRGKALRKWEKRFPQTAKDLKSQTGSMLGKSKALMNLLLAALKQLGKYRSKRSIEEYVRMLPMLQNRYKAYKQSFNAFYNKNVKPYVEAQRAFEERNKQEEPAVPPSKQTPPPGFEEGDLPAKPPPSPYAKAPPKPAVEEPAKPNPFAKWAPQSTKEVELLKAYRKAQEQMAQQEAAKAKKPEPAATSPEPTIVVSETPKEEPKKVPTILATLSK
jgi:hypothetical protein